MRNGEYDGVPFCVSEFSDPEVLKADSEMLVGQLKKSKHWPGNNLHEIRERQEQRLAEVLQEAKRKTG